MKPDASRSLYSRWPVILAVLTAGVGMGLSLHLRSRIAQTEASAARLTAETLRLDTEQELNRFAEVLESVRALHALSDAVDKAAMDEFIEKGLVHQHAILGAFGLAQRISPQLRFILEQEADNGTGGYRVVTQGPDGIWVPADSLPIHYPLTWQSRAGSLKIPVGFDFSSVPQALQTIKRIEQTRRTILVPSPIPDFSFPLPIENQRSGVRGLESEIENRKSNIEHSLPPSPSYWVFSPVIPNPPQANTPQRFESVIGFAVAELNPDKILHRVSLRSSLSPRLQLTLTTEPDLNEKECIRREKGAWLYRQPLETIGAQWTFTCSLPVTATGRRSAAALAFGLIITALMTSQLLLLGNRTKKIENEVCARTEELHMANAQLEANLRERVQLEEQMHELAARERRKIGRDLHDSLGQKLTGAVFLSRSLLNYFSPGDGEPSSAKTSPFAKATEDGLEDKQQSHARTLNETLKSAVGQVRNMARGLAPVTLNDESLGEALEQLAEEMTGLYGVSCEVAECTALPALNQKTKEQLYLIAREAVNNAARHAQAGRITIRLTGNESGWLMYVEDDGKGLLHRRQGYGGQAERAAAVEGMGIRIMRHRASLIGAGFTITSAPAKGTCIEVTSSA